MKLPERISRLLQTDLSTRASGLLAALVGVLAGLAFWWQAETDTEVIALFAVLCVQAVSYLLFWGELAEDESTRAVMVATGNGFALGLTVLQFVDLWQGILPWALIAVALTFPLLVVASVLLIKVAAAVRRRSV